nr:TlpA disulfide reductase family protein [uncultured Flavobacterium sp.]
MFSFKNIATTLLVVFGFAFSQAQIKIGDALPAITLQNYNGKTVKLNSFKGKAVLIDFWASWCAPCRVANKNLVKLNQKYASQGLTMVSISIDTDDAKWKKAIAKDKMTHAQLIDPKGFKAPAAIKFGVEALPAAYLFDKNGKLVAINPTDKQIIDQLKK